MHLLTNKKQKEIPQNSKEFASIYNPFPATVLSFARVDGIGVGRHGSKHTKRTGSDFGITQNFPASIRTCCCCVSESRGGLAQRLSLLECGAKLV